MWSCCAEDEGESRTFLFSVAIVFLEKAAHHIIGNPKSVKTTSCPLKHCCLWLSVVSTVVEPGGGGSGKAGVRIL